MSHRYVINMTIQEKLLLSKVKRNSEWEKIKRQHLKQFPKCAVCGTMRNVTVHHIKPHYLFPSLELDKENLITLCEDGANHHLTFGHLNDFKSYNESVATDAAIWNERIKNRPRWR